MKTKRITVTILAFFGVIYCSSCKKAFSDFGDVNTDPTKSSKMSPALQLAFSELRFSGYLNTQERTTAILLMPMMQQSDGGPYSLRYGALYIKNAPYTTSMWENGYPNELLNIVDATARSAANPATPNLNAICRIVKVYLFARVTDLYGDIPYNEAGEAYLNGVSRPKFDAQKDIYDNFLKELAAASQQLDPTKDIVTQDIFYKGNVALWKKFANSLRLRLALRLVKRDPERAKTEITAAYNAGVFTSNSDICMTVHEDVQNSYSDLRGNSASVSFNQQTVLPRVCTTLLNQLKTTNDPRLTPLVRVYRDLPGLPFNRTDVTDLVKAKIGLVGCIPGHYIYDDFLDKLTITIPTVGNVTLVNNEQKAQFANWLIRNNAPFFHMTYAEVEFLLADATVRLGLTLGASAAVHYQNGITAACQQLSLFPGGPVIAPVDISTFITANPLTAGKELELINKQLWINYIMNGPELFANWRRTGFPVLVSAASSESSSLTIPRRFEYPLSEKERNADNAKNAISLMGGTDDWTNRVWWDMP
jgi:hypothetical protein